MNSTAQAGIEFADASYAVGGRHILHGINLTVGQGETMVLLGRSGSGKSTALKLVNRLLLPTSGEVYVEGKSTRKWDPICLRRRIGYAIQEIGLFPHLTVAQNIALLPKLTSWPQERIASRVSELLGMAGLSSAEFLGRYPDELSGGQRQRVGLARALALDPPMLLLDEPFGALDPLTRADLQREFKHLSALLKKTVIFVTHDAHEALLLASRIAVLDRRELQGIFTPKQFLDSGHPAVQPYIEALRTSTEPDR